jgi:hypothetical protein
MVNGPIGAVVIAAIWIALFLIFRAKACALLNDHILEPWDIVASKLRESGHA